MDRTSPNRRQTLAEMLNPNLKPAGSSQPASPKRRLSMAEMLRQSPLVGNTVPLADAIESAQAAAERKACEEEATAPCEATPPSAPACPESKSPSVSVEPIAFASPTTAPSRAIKGANVYNLYARVGGRWVWQCDVSADGHAEGMRQAIACLKPEYDSLPIRLEQDDASAARRAIRRSCATVNARQRL